jgi:hypothetical protein
MRLCLHTPLDFGRTWVRVSGRPKSRSKRRGQGSEREAGWTTLESW